MRPPMPAVLFLSDSNNISTSFWGRTKARPYRDGKTKARPYRDVKPMRVRTGMVKQCRVRTVMVKTKAGPYRDGKTKARPYGDGKTKAWPNRENDGRIWSVMSRIRSGMSGNWECMVGDIFVDMVFLMFCWLV